jgi:LCP family protein required for cell wall assembly
MLNKYKVLLIPVFIVLISLIIFAVSRVAVHKKIELVKEKTGNINVLILGRGGGTHEGPDLTDTIMLAMINPSKKRIDIVSIPRDIWIPEIKGKINKAYSIGQKKDGQGLLMARAVVEKVTGQNIDYAFVIDFSGFVNLVDHLGGIDVVVSRTFDDYAYPIEGKEDDPCGKTEDEIASLSAEISTGSATESESFPCRYKHLHFDQGSVHMTGIQALEFSRSRHALNGDGNDFARSQRQQAVISAIREKALSLGIILNPVKVIGAFNIIRDNIDTNIQVDQIDDFINLGQEMQDSAINSFVIDFGDENKGRFGLLEEPVRTADKGYQAVLTPRIGDGNFTEVHEYVKCILDGLICAVDREGIVKKEATD